MFVQFISTSHNRDLITPYLDYKDCIRLRRVNTLTNIVFQRFALSKYSHWNRFPGPDPKFHRYVNPDIFVSITSLIGLEIIDLEEGMPSE
eukprot:UN27801